MREIPIVQCKYCNRNFREDKIMMFDLGLKKFFICSDCYNEIIRQFDVSFDSLNSNKSSDKRYKRKYFESGSLSGMMQTLNKYHSTSKVVAIFKDNEKYIAITETEIKESENDN